MLYANPVLDRSDRSIVRNGPIRAYITGDIANDASNDVLHTNNRSFENNTQFERENGFSNDVNDVNDVIRSSCTQVQRSQWYD